MGVLASWFWGAQWRRAGALERTAEKACEVRSRNVAIGRLETMLNPGLKPWASLDWAFSLFFIGPALDLR